MQNLVHKSVKTIRTIGPKSEIGLNNSFFSLLLIFVSAFASSAALETFENRSDERFFPSLTTTATFQRLSKGIEARSSYLSEALDWSLERRLTNKAQCLKITQNVSYEVLAFWHFPSIFVLLPRQVSGFTKVSG